MGKGGKGHGREGGREVREGVRGTVEEVSEAEEDHCWGFGGREGWMLRSERWVGGCGVRDGWVVGRTWRARTAIVSWVVRNYQPQCGLIYKVNIL